MEPPDAATDLTEMHPVGDPVHSIGGALIRSIRYTSGSGRRTPTCAINAREPCAEERDQPSAETLGGGRVL